MEDKLRLGISSCLLGHPVRYDGQHKLDRFLRDTLGRYVDWVPVCPEVGCGLPVPREAMHLEQGPEGLRLVTNRTRRDVTDLQKAWIARTLPELETRDLHGFVFKSKSPSSGLRDAKRHSAAGMPAGKGPGLFAGAFLQHFPLLPVEDEGRLQDVGLRENFIERVFTFQRWRRCEEDCSPAALVAFHARHKLLVMSHSVTAARALGKLVAGAGPRPSARLFEAYAALLLPALRLQATRRKHTNVLQHMLGYFKHELPPSEKADLHAQVEEYRLGRLPLIVPIVLLRCLARRFEQSYLLAQQYLEPAPAELLPRNQVQADASQPTRAALHDPGS